MDRDGDLPRDSFRDRRSDDSWRAPTRESYRPFSNRSSRRPSPRPVPVSPVRSRSPSRPVVDSWAPSASSPTSATASATATTTTAAAGPPPPSAPSSRPTRPRSRSPPSFRRRSRSPFYRPRPFPRDESSPASALGYPSRKRSPPPPHPSSRRFSPPPPRDMRRPYYSNRSPPGGPNAPAFSHSASIGPPSSRGRSPPPLKRYRSPSPALSYRPRSPKRERFLSPPSRPRYDRGRERERERERDRDRDWERERVKEKEQDRARDRDRDRNWDRDRDRGKPSSPSATTVLPSRGPPSQSGPPPPLRPRSRSPPSSSYRDERHDSYADKGSWRRRSPPPLSKPSSNYRYASGPGSWRSSPPPFPADRSDISSGAPTGYPGRSPMYYRRPRNTSRPPPPKASSPYYARSPPRRSGLSREPSMTRQPSPSIVPSRPTGSSPHVNSPEVTRRSSYDTSADSDRTRSSRRPPSSAIHPSRDPAPIPSRAGAPTPSRPRPMQDSPRSISPTSMAPTAPSSLPRGPRAGPGFSPVLSAPTRPRGAYSRESPYSRDRDVPARPRASHRSPTYLGPPSGPRGGPAPPYYDPHRPSPRRHGSLSSAPFSRPPPHRQQPDYLSDLPAIIPGGRLRPSGLDPAVERRLAQLENDRHRLQTSVGDKQKAKRARLRDWERLVRESSAGALRSELAEAHLQKLTEGDGIIGGVAF